MSAAVWLKGGDFDPEALTDRVGIEPSLTHRLGELGPFGRPRATAWVVRSGPCPALDIGPLLAEVVERIGSRVPMLRQIADEWELRIVLSCPVQLSSTLSPAMEIPPQIVRFASELGAAIDIDVMCVPSADEAGMAQPPERP